jgi:hypothetical protein
MITEKILKELGFERHPALRIPEFWDLWLSDNTYNEKEHKFNRVLYIKVDFYDTDNSWYASRDNYIKDGSCNVRLGLGPGGPHDCSEEFPLLRRLKDAEKLKALIEILKGDE